MEGIKREREREGREKKGEGERASREREWKEKPLFDVGVMREQYIGPDVLVHRCGV